jgi:hypothetical protein
LDSIQVRLPFSDKLKKKTILLRGYRFRYLILTCYSRIFYLRMMRMFQAKGPNPQAESRQGEK